MATKKLVEEVEIKTDAIEEVVQEEVPVVEEPVVEDAETVKEEVAPKKSTRKTKVEPVVEEIVEEVVEPVKETVARPTVLSKDDIKHRLGILDEASNHRYELVLLANDRFFSNIEKVQRLSTCLLSNCDATSAFTILTR